MKIKIILILFLLALTSTGCYAGITGIVVDAETGRPIEGAVVLVEWTITKGLGLTYQELYKVEEIETDGKGNFEISRAYNPFLNPPTVVIYKPNYIAWRNDYIFPGWEKRAGFKLKNGTIVKLEKFGNEYSHNQHLDFLEYRIMSLYELSITELPKFRKGIKFEKELIKKSEDINE